MECFKTVLSEIAFVAVIAAVIVAITAVYFVVCAYTGLLFGVGPNSIGGVCIMTGWAIVFLGTSIGIAECHA